MSARISMTQGGRKQGGTGCWCPPTFAVVYSVCHYVYMCVVIVNAPLFYTSLVHTNHMIIILYTVHVFTFNF